MNSNFIEVIGKIIALTVVIILVLFPAFIILKIAELFLGEFSIIFLMVYVGIGGLLAVYRTKTQNTNMPLWKVILYWYGWPVMLWRDKE
jgi:hypothetical protein